MAEKHNLDESSDPQITFSCVECKRPNSADNLVACDRCQNWWHYSCAEVDDSIADRDWICRRCVKPASKPPSVTSSSARRARAELNLQRLAEKMELEKRQLELEIEKKFMEERYRVMEQTLAEEEEDYRSIRSARSRFERQKEVSDWVENSVGVCGAETEQTDELPVKKLNVDSRVSGPDEGVEQEGAVGGVCSSAPKAQQDAPSTQQKQNEQVPLEKHQTQPMLQQLKDLHARLSEMQLPPKPKMQPTVPPTLNVAAGAIPKQRSNDVFDASRAVSNYKQPRFSAPLEKEMREESKLWSTAPRTVPTLQQPNSRFGETQTCNVLRLDAITADPQRAFAHSNQQLYTNPRMERPGGHQELPPQLLLPRLTQEQLAARQVLPRDLPTFTGDPADWPVFISNYNYSNEACGYSNGENMIRLQRCLKGAAWESMRSRLILPASVPHVIEALRMRYGRPELLIESLIERVKSSPSPKADRLETMIDFGTMVQTLCDHIVAAELLDHLANPSLLKDLVTKLPAEYRMKWAGFRRSQTTIDLKTFATFMEEIVADAYSVSSCAGPGKFDHRAKAKQPDRNLVHTTDSCGNEEKGRVDENGPHSEDKPVKLECSVCQKEGHKARDCWTFKSLSVDDRWRKIQSLGLCRTCLFGHGRRACRNTMRCGIDGCQSKHHPLLHSTSSAPAPANQEQSVDHHVHQALPSLLFRILPVTLYNGTTSINTFAFLDEGSSLTMVEDGLAAKLGVDGYNQPLCLKWTANMTRHEKNSRRVAFEISGLGEKKRFQITDVGTIESLDLPTQSLPFEELAERYQHLRGLPVASYREATPQLLIGLDNLRLAVPLKSREGNYEEPTAVKTRLGWCVYGGRRSSDALCHFHLCECNNDRLMDDTMQAYFTSEEVGVQPTTVAMSKEEKRALDILQQTTVRVGDHYESGLLWKYDDFEFPDSFPMAVRRLECLERRMAKDPDMKANIMQKIEEYQVKGYAHRATREELLTGDPRRTWYLPLGAVVNPKKPGKIRLIWDASAKVDGVSLNTFLLKGPDQLTALPSVLFRFRQYPVAVSADIREMFHQIGIRNEDKHAQRFVWRSDPAQAPDVFIMDVATFGSSSSPATAQYVKNWNAQLFADRFPRAVEGIVLNHYVDDYLDSFEEESEALQVASEVRAIHKHGGFDIRNWCSNRPDVLEGLGESAETAVKDLNPENKADQSERVLGMLWFTETDEFRFPTTMRSDIAELIDSGRQPTKREILRCVMTLFDPLGVLAPYLIQGKMLIQDVWRAGVGWDQQIPSDLFEKWQKWIETLNKINSVTIPRCYFRFTSGGGLCDIQIHTFVDASELAYACVSYFRILHADGTVEVALIMAKTKVAPVKPMTIPRLELQGCVQGARMAKYVTEGHSYQISKRYFWSDSATALSWINADPRKYRPFVAYRVGEILELTCREEWRWVPTKLNPADEATRWGADPTSNSNSSWYNGPVFLKHPEDQWPKWKSLPQNNEELRSCHVHSEVTFASPVVDIHRFARWTRAWRSMAYVHRAVDNFRKVILKADRTSGPLTQEELQLAEETLFKAAQWDCYPEEISTLRANQHLPLEKRIPLEKSSPLFKFSPMLDEHGILRVDGRIGAAKDATMDVKYPVILPKQHRLTFLLIDQLHRQYRHGNNETVVNEARQRFCVPQLRSLVKKVSRECQMCKIRRASPKVPQMAPLPPARLSSFVRPFSYVGLDYFGPLLVKVGRSQVKRWAALFTCLTVRAVHVELAFDLSTASCVKCVRRFLDRRGSPLEIYSDNGTNLQGAERLLRRQINEGLAATYTNETTAWRFIPPGTPHMGGSWERLVRSIKVALPDGYDNDRLNDEDLMTLLVEAEAIVNSRPLTYLPLDSDEQESLTPNHFLLGSSSGVRQPMGVVGGDESKILKESWTAIQKQLDRFWKRWVREYLPTLTKRTKWFAPIKNIEASDLVLLIDDTRRNGWIRGRVLEVLPGKDGIVRQAIVQTAGGVFRRPVSKMAVLEVAEAGETLTSGGFHGGEDVAAKTDGLATLPK